MAGLTRAMREFEAHKRRYFTAARCEIAVDNARFLRLASCMMLALLVLLMICATILVGDWRPSAFHIAFLPASSLLCVGIHLALRHATPFAVSALCILYEIVLYTFVILIDTVGDTRAPSMFMQLVSVTMTGLFILPDRWGLGLFAAAEAIFALLVILVKDPIVAQYDLFGIIAGVTFSVCLSRMVMSFRLRSFDLQATYEVLSMHDALSNLYNRRAFMERARDYIDRANPRASCSLAFIDLDDFKYVNDTFGHAVGDQVISELSRILSKQFRPSDVISRFGGDEFLVLLDNLTDEQVLKRRFARIMQEYADRAVLIVGHRLSLSVGIVCARDQEVSLEGLISQADASLYDAKRAGKDSVRICGYDVPPSCAGIEDSGNLLGAQPDSSDRQCP